MQTRSHGIELRNPQASFSSIRVSFIFIFIQFFEHHNDGFLRRGTVAPVRLTIHYPRNAMSRPEYISGYDVLFFVRGKCGRGWCRCAPVLRPGNFTETRDASYKTLR